MAEPLLVIEDLYKNFGGIIATDHLHLDVNPGEIHAIIGPNGAGKTSLIAQLCGVLASDRGVIRFDGQDITRAPPADRVHRGLARSFQVTSVLRDFSCLDNVALAVQARSGHSFRFWRAARRDPRLRDEAARALEGVGLGERGATIAGDLAHGEQRQLEVAMALATSPKMLLLDEPMAGMGRADGEWMTRYLASLKGQYAMLLVEHDMDAVFALADRITVLVYGRAIATGTLDEIRGDAAVREAYLGEG